MKLTKKTLSASLAMCMALGTCSLFPMSAQAAAYNWDARPDWTPHDFNSAMEFINTYGNTHIQDGMICIVRNVPDNCQLTADIDAKGCTDIEGRTDASHEYRMFSFNYKFPEKPDESDEEAYRKYEDEMREIEFHGISDENFLGYHYEALMILENCENKFDIKVKTLDKENNFAVKGTTAYSFEDEKETDILGWLPDSYPEHQKFLKENGTISYHDGKLVYCGDVNYSTGAAVNTEQSGDGKLKHTYTSFASNEMVFKPTGNTSFFAEVYEGEKAGDVEISFDNNIPWAPEDSKKEVVKASVRVDESLKVHERSSDIPDWIPQDYDSVIKFINSHGQTFVNDGVICCVRRIDPGNKEYYAYSYSGSASENIKSYVTYTDVIVKNSVEGRYNGYEVIAYDIPKNTDITINFDYGRYKKEAQTTKSFIFEKDETDYITQKDIYAWLPDCEEEFNAYYAKHGMFSIQAGYVMVCYDNTVGSNYGYENVQSGSGGLVEYYNDSIINEEDTYNDGGTLHNIRLYKPVRAGAVEFKIIKRNGSKKNVDDEAETAYYMIDKDMKISDAEKKDVKTSYNGDCNGDGIVGISDAVTLQKWLHGKGNLSEFGMADINGDGTVDVFDLIVLKKKIISSMTEAPKPVMVDISENFAWSIHQNVTVYDQYGTAYSFKLSDSHNNYEKYNKENILINMDSDNWYEQILDIMDKANQSASENTKDESKSKQQIVYKKTVNALPDRALEVVNDFAKTTAKYSNEEVYARGYACDMGSSSIYTIGENSEGKPERAFIATFGDGVGWVDKDEVKLFVKTLIEYNLFNYQIVTVLEKDYR